MENKYDSLWSPEAYLAQFYTTSEVASDELGILDFVYKFLRNENPRFSTMIEVGCGPTIHHLIPFVPYVRGIFLADYLESNLSQLLRWINKFAGAHDWSTYFKGVLEFENSSEVGDITVFERMNELRNKIVQLMRCDVLAENPLKSQAKIFDLVTSFYCLECVTNTKASWHQAMRNLSSLVAPNGWLVLSAVHNTDGYKVGEVNFPTTRIREEDMRSALADNNFSPESIEVSVYESPEWSAEGFSSILVARGKKA